MTYTTMWVNLDPQNVMELHNTFSSNRGDPLNPDLDMSSTGDVLAGLKRILRFVKTLPCARDLSLLPLVVFSPASGSW